MINFNKINLKVIFSLSAFIIILFYPKPEGLSIEAWRVAAVGILMALLWATEAIPSL